MRVGEEATEDIVLPNDDIDALMRKAAEQVYAVQSPVRYAAWLDQHGRTDEAVRMLRVASASGSPAQRADALARLADFAATTEEAVGLLHQSDALNQSSLSVLYLAMSEQGLGQRENAAKHFKRGYDIERARGAGALRSPNGLTAATFPLEDHGDFVAALGLRCADYHVSPCTPQALATAALTTRPDSYAIDRRAEFRPIRIAGAIAGTHDTRTAQSLLDRYRPDVTGRSAAFVRAMQVRRLATQTRIDRQRGDWASAAALVQEAIALGSRWEVDYGFGSEDLTPAAELPDALAHAGRLAEAEALVARTPVDCTPALRCLRPSGNGAPSCWPADPPTRPSSS